MTTGILKRAAIAATLSTVAVTGIGTSPTAYAQDKTITACTGSNASTDPACKDAKNPELPKPTTPGTPNIVTQTNAQGGSVNIKTPSLTANLLLKGDAVGAPDPSSAIPMGYVSETQSPVNIPLIGAAGRAIGVTKPLPGVLEMHLKTQECLRAVTTSDGLGRIQDNMGIVAAQQMRTILSACDPSPHAYSAVVYQATNCVHGVTLGGTCKEAPTSTSTSEAAAAQNLAAQKAAIEQAAAAQIMAAQKAAADQIAAAQKAADARVAAAQKAAQSRKLSPEFGCRVWGPGVTMNAAVNAECDKLFAAAKAPAPAASR